METEEDEYFAMACGRENGILITIVKADTHKPQKFLSALIVNVENFLDTSSEFFTALKYKCILIDMTEYVTEDNQDNIKICYRLKEEIEKLKIPYFFISPEMMLPVALLTVTKTTANYGEIIIIICIDSGLMRSFTYRRCSQAFEIIRLTIITPEETRIKSRFREALFKGQEPQQVIAFCPSPEEALLSSLSQIVNAENFKIVHELPTFEPEVIAELCMWRLNPTTRNKYFIKPRTSCRFYASQKNISDNNDYDLVVDVFEELPLIRKFTFPRTFSHLYISQSREQSLRKPYKSFALKPKMCHRMQLTLSIDVNNLPKVSFDKIMVPEILSLPDVLDKIGTIRAPVIAFFDNASVICIYNEGKYQFLETWNGVYGKNLYLNLKPEKPVLLDKPALKDSSVIKFDELCMIAKGETPKDLCSGIRIVENSKMESILEFDTDSGSPKQCNAKFLMAIIIREHYSAIKRKTRVKHDKLGFHYVVKVDEIFKVEEARQQFQQLLGTLLQAPVFKQEIQDFLRESCNMLRVQYCEETSEAIKRTEISLGLESLLKI